MLELGHSEGSFLNLWEKQDHDNLQSLYQSWDLRSLSFSKLELFTSSVWIIYRYLGEGVTGYGPRGIYAHPIVQKCDTQLKVLKQLSLVTENFIPSHQWSYGTRKLKLTVALGMNFLYWFSFFLLRLLVADENYKNLDW